VRRLAVVAAVLVLGIACGAEGDDEPAADRTVEVAMVDTAFEPATLAVRAGETIRFEFRNTGSVAHDAFVGDRRAQQDHEREMRGAEDDGHDGHGGGDDDALTVEAGDTGELTHTFDRRGTYEVGCHQPGHYQAGMKMTVEVR
jgi:uncharacterized cupredoxin-like copper-binding protein